MNFYGISRIACFMISVCILTSCTGNLLLPPVQTVQRIDLERYSGLWYEVARFSNDFQVGCSESTAYYTLLKNGELSVTNSCRFGIARAIKEVSGRAWVADPSSNARLKVSFFWPFRGDYWIIELGSNYEYAVVGTPDRRLLWVLSRTPHLDEQVFSGIVWRLEQQGFDIKRLHSVIQKK